jgi:hypothetical protein
MAVARGSGFSREAAGQLEAQPLCHQQKCCYLTLPKIDALVVLPPLRSFLCINLDILGEEDLQVVGSSPSRILVSSTHG